MNDSTKVRPEPAPSQEPRTAEELADTLAELQALGLVTVRGNRVGIRRAPSAAPALDAETWLRAIEQDGALSEAAIRFARTLAVNGSLSAEEHGLAALVELCRRGYLDESFRGTVPTVRAARLHCRSYGGRTMDAATWLDECVDARRRGELGRRSMPAVAIVAWLSSNDLALLTPENRHGKVPLVLTEAWAANALDGAGWGVDPEQVVAAVRELVAAGLVVVE